MNRLQDTITKNHVSKSKIAIYLLDTDCVILVAVFFLNYTTTLLKSILILTHRLNYKAKTWISFCYIEKAETCKCIRKQHNEGAYAAHFALLLQKKERERIEERGVRIK